LEATLKEAKPVETLGGLKIFIKDLKQKDLKRRKDTIVKLEPKVQKIQVVDLRKMNHIHLHKMKVN